jgi:hypothetical protein
VPCLSLVLALDYFGSFNAGRDSASKLMVSMKYILRLNLMSSFYSTKARRHEAFVLINTDFVSLEPPFPLTQAKFRTISKLYSSQTIARMMHEHRASPREAAVLSLYFS